MYCNNCQRDTGNEEFCPKCGHNVTFGGRGIYKNGRKAISAYRKTSVIEKIRFALSFVFIGTFLATFGFGLLSLCFGFFGETFSVKNYILQVVLGYISYFLLVLASHAGAAYSVFYMLSMFRLPKWIVENGIDTRRTLEDQKNFMQSPLVVAQLLVDKPSKKPLNVVNHVFTIVFLTSGVQAVGITFVVFAYLNNPLKLLITSLIASNFDTQPLSDPLTWITPYMMTFIFTFGIVVAIVYIVIIFPTTITNGILNRAALKNFSDYRGY